jgi:hypothetical protein
VRFDDYFRFQCKLGFGVILFKSLWKHEQSLIVGKFGVQLEWNQKIDTQQRKQTRQKYPVANARRRGFISPKDKDRTDNRTDFTVASTKQKTEGSGLETRTSLSVR